MDILQEKSADLQLSAGAVICIIQGSLVTFSSFYLGSGERLRQRKNFSG